MSKAIENVKNNKSESGLRSQCLSFTEVLAQSIANIAPSVGPVIGIPLVFATAGNGTWLTYLFATIAVVLVGYNINLFAKRSSSPGALYTFVSEGLGPAAGFISGWGLVLAYLLTASAVLAGMSNYTNVLLGYVGMNIQPMIICLVGALLAWLMVYRDIQVSAKLMLALEGISLLFIFILGAIVLIHGGFHIHMAQFKLEGVSSSSIRIGLVLAFFSFVGFESATALGDEAKNPKKTIPKAVIMSAVIVGMIFMVFSYTLVMGFAGLTTKLNEAQAPLTLLADKNGVGFMGVIISFGAIISFWSCAIASITAGARILFTMGRHKIMPTTLGKIHGSNDTPHVAVTVCAVIVFVIPAIMFAFKSAVMDIFGYLGTIATLGFLFSYALIVLAAPVYLYKKKELKPVSLIVSLVTFVVLLIPIIGSIYPLPPYPYSLLPFIFLGWLILSGSWFAFINVFKSHVVSDMKKEIKDNNEKYAASINAVDEAS